MSEKSESERERSKVAMGCLSETGFHNENMKSKKKKQVPSLYNERIGVIFWRKRHQESDR